MARIERSRTGKFIFPETEQEKELIAHGARHGDTLVLLESYYTIHHQALVLPDSSSFESCQRVCSAFERAALSHQRAVNRRKKFVLLDD